MLQLVHYSAIVSLLPLELQDAPDKLNPLGLSSGAEGQQQTEK